MTIPGPELQRIRESLGLSRVEFARELGLTGNQDNTFKTMTMLEMGDKPVSLPMAKLAWLLSTMPSLPDWPRDLKVGE